MIRVIDEHHLQVGDRTWWGEFNRHGFVHGEFAFERRQFIVRFESKWSVSIIWGSMSYSDNHDHGFGRGPHETFNEQPERVEAAVLHADREGLQGNDSDPFSYLDEYQLNALLAFVGQLATDEQFEVLQFDRDDAASRRPDATGANEGVGLS